MTHENLSFLAPIDTFQVRRIDKKCEFDFHAYGLSLETHDFVWKNTVWVQKVRKCAKLANNNINNDVINTVT